MNNLLSSVRNMSSFKKIISGIDFKTITVKEANKKLSDIFHYFRKQTSDNKTDKYRKSLVLSTLSYLLMVARETDYDSGFIIRLHLHSDTHMTKTHSPFLTGLTDYIPENALDYVNFGILINVATIGNEINNIQPMIYDKCIVHLFEELLSGREIYKNSLCHYNKIIETTIDNLLFKRYRKHFNTMYKNEKFMEYIKIGQYDETITNAYLNGF